MLLWGPRVHAKNNKKNTTMPIKIKGSEPKTFQVEKDRN